MIGFRSYAFSLVLISVSSSVVIMLAPERSGLIKYVRWITALCITAALLFPITSAGRGIEIGLNNKYSSVTGDRYDLHETNELIIDSLKDELTKKISSMVKSKFGAEVIECSVTLNCNDIENISVTNISLAISTKSSFLISDVKKYLSKTFETVVFVKGAD